MFRCIVDSNTTTPVNTILGAGLVTYEIFPNDALCLSNEKKQFRFPKSKKVRIRKKWAKKNNNYKLVEVSKIVYIGNRVYMSSKQYFQYKEAMLKRIDSVS